ncbi:hypothetical protein J3A83DRAFT_4196265 [Scleroderma citrinum]
MSNYYWPQNTIIALHKDYMFQVLYTYNKTYDPGVIQIKQMNHHNRVSQKSHHAFLPMVYEDHICHLLWRYYLLITLYQHFQTHQAKRYQRFLPKMIKMIAHLDNVIKAVIQPSLQIPFEWISKYCSSSFHEYLITKFLIGCHDHKMLQTFREGCPIYIQHMNMAKFCEDYFYDATPIQWQDFKELWTIVERWYMCDLNTAWISSWVSWKSQEPDKEQENDNDNDKADMDLDPHNVPILSHLRQPAEGENHPSFMGQLTVSLCNVDPMSHGAAESL